MSIRESIRRKKIYNGKIIRPSSESGTLGTNSYKKIYSFRPQQFRGNYIEPVIDDDRIPIDSYDLLVYEFKESADPFVNTGSALNANLSIHLVSGDFLYNQSDPWGGNHSVGMNTPTIRNTAYGANYVRPQAPITMSFWLYHHSRVSTYTQHFFQKQTSTGFWSGGTYTDIVIQTRHYASDSNGWEAFISGVAGGHLIYTTPNDIPLNEWVHLGLTYDGSFFKVYKNGVLMGSNPASGLIAYNAGVGAGPWFINAIPSGSGAPEGVRGVICDARVATTIRDITWFQAVYASKTV